jgi:uncharacterized protein with LGFP repeats
MAVRFEARRLRNHEENMMRSFFLVGLFLLGLAASAQPAAAADVRMYAKHEVTDYAAWRKAYNDFDKARRKLGVTAQVVYQSADNPNDVTVTHDFKSLDKAKAFAASPELKTAMEKAGVKGAPQIWFTMRATK